jgi:hypothetical protein
MKLREGIELAHAPVTHVHVLGAAGVVRVDKLTIEEAREVIVRICDELQTYREDLYALRQERRGHV